MVIFEGPDPPNAKAGRCPTTRRMTYQNKIKISMYYSSIVRHGVPPAGFIPHVHISADGMGRTHDVQPSCRARTVFMTVQLSSCMLATPCSSGTASTTR